MEQKLFDTNVQWIKYQVLKEVIRRASIMPTPFRVPLLPGLKPTLDAASTKSVLCLWTESL